MSGLLGLYGLFGWVHLGMVRRRLTTNGCDGADAVHARCNNSHNECAMSTPLIRPFCPVSLSLQ